MRPRDVDDLPLEAYRSEDDWTFVNGRRRTDEAPSETGLGIAPPTPRPARRIGSQSIRGGRRAVVPVVIMAGVALIALASTTQSHVIAPAPTFDDDQFRSFYDTGLPVATAGPMDDMASRISVTPAPTPEPAETPWPTHPPRPKLAGGPYKPWRVFDANVQAARDWLKGMLSATSFRCIDVLWDRESRWRVHAGNRSSGAYGIPQSLPGSKMAAYGDDWRDNATTQVEWGYHYIRARYGNPCVALDHSYRTGWY